MIAESSSVPLRRKRGPDNGLRSVFKDHLKSWHFTPIETGGIVSGVPDAEYCAPGGVSGWIEFKYVRGPKSNDVGLRPAQVAWIDRRVRSGGRAFIAIQRKSELFLYSGVGVKELKRNGLASQLGLLYHGVTQRAWDWDAVRRILSSPI